MLGCSGVNGLCKCLYSVPSSPLMLYISIGAFLERISCSLVFILEMCQKTDA